MKNTELLFEKNGILKKKPKIINGIIPINIFCGDNFFSGIEIRKIIEIINSIHRYYGKVKIPIYFYFNNVKFIDKLTYIFVECICYELIKNYGHRVQIYMNVEKEIGTEGIASSPLLLLNETSNEKVIKYIERFNKDGYGYHFRRVIDGCDIEDTNYLGDLYQEIDSFLKIFGISDECRDDVSLVISELTGNACEHAESDCLIDIDITHQYNKEINDTIDENYYYGINIVVINFSDKLLGDDIQENILSHEKGEFNQRYQTIFNVLKNHSKMFNEEYYIEDFRNITTFQKRISGRSNKFNTGGTGLTKLIQSLEEQSEAYRCYVISGKRCINFFSKMLEYDKNGWIGFNLLKDYINNIPGQGVTTECLIFMPGTAYNFNFIMRGEKIIDE